MLLNWGVEDLESPLDCKEIQPVHSKGDQSWVLIERTDVEAETPILCPPHAKSWLIGKDLDAWRDWGQEEKRASEGEMTGWHHRYNEHELGQTPGDSEGQGGVACCSPWGRKEPDMTGNWTTTKRLKIGWGHMMENFVNIITLHSIMSIMGNYQWLTINASVSSSPRCKQ